MIPRTMLLAGLLAPLAAAQPPVTLPSPPATPPATAPTAQPAPPAQKEAPPAFKLGVRVEGIRRAWAVIPVVYLVPDEVSYIEAIASWTPRARFPVLFDDGSERAREDIARFVRGFKPTRILRWSYAADQAQRDTPQLKPWPADPAQRRAMIEQAVFRIWANPLPGETDPPKIASQSDLIARWKKLGIPIPGIVIADANDAAWPAALALAAGRCEPIAWATPETGVNGAMTRAGFDRLETELEKACDDTGLSWRNLGDEIDAATLCVNSPVKVQIDPGTVAATTDLLARHPERGAEGKPTARDKGDRWAWAGQIFGNAAEASYSAMCALFLTPTTAWVFDGYPDVKPWNEFDGARASKALSEAGLGATLDDSPKNNEKAWRVRSAFGIDAGLIAVNTKGMADEFNLEPGQCRPGEVPFLRVPSIVYFVHSWSAAAPQQRATVAGRWMERGAYAYMGSVYEPYLQAFVPTPLAMLRMTSAFPWGAAIRPDNTSPVWKLATIGDPLITLGPPAPRVDERLPQHITTNLEAAMRQAIAARTFEEAIIDLTLLGRDADAAKLGAALSRDEPAAFTPQVAMATLLPALRARDTATVLACYAQFSPAQAADPIRRDALWHACWLGLSTDPSEAMLQTLRVNLRPDQIGQDAAELMRPIASRFGRDTAITMLNEARPKATTDYDRRQIDEALKVFLARPSRPPSK